MTERIQEIWHQSRKDVAGGLISLFSSSVWIQRSSCYLIVGQSCSWKRKSTLEKKYRYSDKYLCYNSAFIFIVKSVQCSTNLKIYKNRIEIFQEKRKCSLTVMGWGSSAPFLLVTVERMVFIFLTLTWEEGKYGHSEVYCYLSSAGVKQETAAVAWLRVSGRERTAACL